MASRGNPNTPSKSRRVANRAKVQRRNAVNKVTKNARGTRNSTVLAPTSGPAAPLSSKKARKVEKAKNHARKRAIEKAMEQEGEVEMTGKTCAFKYSLAFTDFFCRCTKDNQVEGYHKERGWHGFGCDCMIASLAQSLKHLQDTAVPASFDIYNE